MSETIDQKVVEMKFDNGQFENNVRTSMSTLEKLKEKLNLTGATKGLESVNNAAKNVNLNGIGSAVETVQAKFSAMQVVGVTALANITNKAVDAGERIVKALTIDPVKTGFEEYETQINAVQTILANTKSKGSTINDVNAALDELNKYADLTIYNFTEMTRNIGTFTAAGVDLETSVSAIQGIANLAAVSGSTSLQASTAMYQLSQALAAGKVSLMDWNSVVNAGMGGEVFQTALRKTSEELKTGAEAAIEAKGSFRESLQAGWLTADVLTETLKKFTTSGANEYVAEYTGLSKKAVETALEHAKAEYGEAEAVDKASEALAKKSGKSKDAIKEALEMAETATDAATKVKTFTQLWDVMKEAAQSGWSKTWQLIIGDFEEAKEFFTPLADFATNVIGKFSDARNNLLEGALNNPFAKLIKKLDKVTTATKTVTKAMENYGDIVNKVIGGKYGNGQARWDKLAKEGYDWAKVQNMVNEKLGSSVRHTEQATKATEDLNESQAVTIEQLVAMSDAQLKEVGFTKKEIAAFRELQEQSEKTGVPLKEIIKDTESLSGRTLLINSFKNAGKGLVTVFTAMGKAWRSIFPAMTSEQLYNIIAAIHKFSTSLVVGKKSADKFYRTFRGVFSLLKIAKTLIAGPVSIAFKALQGILGAFDMDILDLTANLGDAIYNFSEWLDKAMDFTAIFKWMKPYILEAVDAIKSFGDSVKNSAFVGDVIDKITNGFEKLKEVDLREIGKNIIEGLKNGMENEGMSVVNTIINIGKGLIEGICNLLGIHSPSTVFMAIGGFIVAGLLLGLNSSIPEVNAFFANLVNRTKETFSNIDWKNVFAVGVSIALIGIIKKLTNIVEAFAAPLQGLGELLEDTGAALLNFSKAAKMFAFRFAAKGVKDIAIALAIVAGVVVALTLLLSKVDDPKKVWEAVAIVGVLAGVLVGIAAAMNMMSKSSIELNKNGLKMSSITSTLISIALSILLLAQAVKAIGVLDPDEIKQGFAGLAIALTAMIGFVVIYGKLVNVFQAQNINGLGSMMIKLSIAMLLMVGVVKLASMLDENEMKKGAGFAAAFVIFVGLLAKVTRTADFNADKLGKMVLKISFAMLLMIAVVKLAGTLDAGEMFKGAVFAAAFILFIKGLVAVTQVGKETAIAKLGGLLLAVSISMLLMVGVCKLVGMLSAEDLIKGGVAILAFTGIIALMVKIVKMAGSDVPKIATTILALSVAIGVMAGVAILLGLIDVDALKQGIIAVGILGTIISGMIVATKFANNVKSNLIVMTVAIGVMAVAVAALSMIDPKKLYGATAALGILMGMFALMTFAAKGAKSSLGSLIVMTAVVGALAGIIYVLGGLDIEASMKTAASISLLMIAMAATITITAAAGSVSPMALVSIGAMTLVVAALATIIGVMSALNVEGSIATATALSELLLAMSAALLIVSFIGPTAAAGVVGLAGVAIVVGMLTGILYLLKDLPISSTLVNAASLSVLLLSLSAACAIMSLIPAAGAIQGAVGLAAFVGIMTGVLVAIGAFSKIPGFNELVTSGGETLALVGYAIGKFVGSIIGGFGAGMSSGLPEIGSNLSAFMLNATPFIAGVKAIDQSVIDGVKNLAGAIILLTVADFINGMASFKSVGGSFASLGTQLSQFMINATPFLIGIRTIDESSITAAKMLADVVLAITASNVLDHITSRLTGTSSFETFGDQLEAYGKAIVKFSKVVSEGYVNEGAVKAAATAGSLMVELQNKLPGTGGVVQWFSGEKDLANFGAQLRMFGTAIVGFSRTVSEGGINEDAVKAAATAGNIMLKLQEKLPSTGGVVQWITGQKSLGNFGTQLMLFGTAISHFSRVVSEGNINETAVQAAATAGSIMVELQSKLPNTSGVVQFFTGQKSLSTFGANLVAFGDYLVQFSDSVSGLNVMSVTAAATAGTMMASVQKSIPDKKWFDGKVSLPTFGKQMASFGKHMSNFSENVSDINAGAVDTAVSTASILVTLVKRLENLDTSGISSFKTAISELASIDFNQLTTNFSGGVTNFASMGTSLTTALANGITAGKSNVVSAVSSVVLSMIQAVSAKTSSMSMVGKNIVSGITAGIDSRRPVITVSVNNLITAMTTGIRSRASMFRTLGVTLITNFANGISANSAKAANIMKTVTANCVTSVRGYYTNFYSAGSYLVDGFKNGISENTFKAEATATAMAKAALEAAKEALDEHSPSKAMYEVGAYAGQGFVNALSDYAGTAYDYGYTMADSARIGLSTALAKVQELIDSNMDIQPVIRPIIDLSAVQNGSASIAGMIGQTVQLGTSTALSSINTISAAMNQKNQNGGSDEVVRAIDKLSKNLSNVGNTYNSFNGLSYTDDLALSTAFETIVKAARLERRM